MPGHSVNQDALGVGNAALLAQDAVSEAIPHVCIHRFLRLVFPDLLLGTLERLILVSCHSFGFRECLRKLSELVFGLVLVDLHLEHL